MWSSRVGEGLCPLPVLTQAQQMDAMVSYLRGRGYLRGWETYGDSRAYRDCISPPRWLRIAIEFERAGRGSA